MGDDRLDEGDGACGAERVFEGRVVGVSEGDTITVLDDAKTRHKIRFAGIDVPERAFGGKFGLDEPTV